MNNVTAETYTYTADDLCGDPARTQGWREPGFFHKALIKGLASGDNVWYQYGSDVYGWSKRATFRAPQTPGPNVETHLLVTADVGATEPDNCDYQCVTAAVRARRGTVSFDFRAWPHRTLTRVSVPLPAGKSRTRARRTAFWPRTARRTLPCTS